MTDFEKEVKQMLTSDIILILDDQLDLYSDEEVAILKAELSTRSSDEIHKEYMEKQAQYEAEEREFERQEQEKLMLRKKEEAETLRIKEEKLLNSKINNLRNSGCDGYWEYKVLAVYDDRGGISIERMESTLNEMGLQGWHLKVAYSNTLGENKSSIGFGGVSVGTNSTVDQNVLIMERFVRI